MEIYTFLAHLKSPFHLRYHYRPINANLGPSKLKYLFITLHDTQIRTLEVRLSDDDVVKDDHVLSDESTNGNQWDEEHNAHVDQLSISRTLY